MSVTTEMTVTPIFDELAARLGLVWDTDTMDMDMDTNVMDMDTVDGDTTEEPAEAEADTE